MTGRPLRPVTRRSLGGHLPRQLADGTRTDHSVRVAPLSSLQVSPKRTYRVLARFSAGYPQPIGTLSTRYSPVRHFSQRSKLLRVSFDLHVLGMPPAFVLSQDQTLHLKLEPLKTGFDYLLAVISCRFTPYLLFKGRYAELTFAFLLGFLIWFSESQIPKNICSFFYISAHIVAGPNFTLDPKTCQAVSFRRCSFSVLRLILRCFLTSFRCGLLRSEGDNTRIPCNVKQE